MNNKVKRYDPINNDGTCGMCVEDADYGAYVEYADYAALEADNARFQSAIVGMIDLAHEYRHLLTQQRFPDNDEGDAFRRHRDAQVARIERILSAAHAAKVKP